MKSSPASVLSVSALVAAVALAITGRAWVFVSVFCGSFVVFTILTVIDVVASYRDARVFVSVSRAAKSKSGELAFGGLHRDLHDGQDPGVPGNE